MWHIDVGNDRVMSKVCFQRVHVHCLPFYRSEVERERKEELPKEASLSFVGGRDAGKPLMKQPVQGASKAIRSKIDKR